MIFIYPVDCTYPTFEVAQADPCDLCVLSGDMGAGAEGWIWVGPSVFSGVPCGVDYVLTLSTDAPQPVETHTWGEIKDFFR